MKAIGGQKSRWKDVMEKLEFVLAWESAVHKYKEKGKAFPEGDSIS